LGEEASAALLSARGKAKRTVRSRLNPGMRNHFRVKIHLLFLLMSFFLPYLGSGAFLAAKLYSMVAGAKVLPLWLSDSATLAAVLSPVQDLYAGLH